MYVNLIAEWLLQVLKDTRIVLINVQLCTLYHVYRYTPGTSDKERHNLLLFS